MMSIEAWAFFIALAILIPLFVVMRRHATKQAPEPAGGAFGADRRVEEVTPRPSLIAPRPVQVLPQIAPPVALPSVPTAGQLLHLLTPQQRKHTCMAGATGDGKTATMNTLLVADIASGAHCVVCSTHYTAYHPDDQPIDLRPIEHLFEVAYTIPAIAGVIGAAIKEKDRRMALYRDGQPVGGDIVLYLGEWGAIKRALGKGAEDTLQALLDEGRKTRIWIVTEYHSLLVGRTGGDSALREQYKTRLAGNVDRTTWETAVGKAIPQAPVALGTWMTETGPVRVVRPSAEYIAHLATRRPAFAAPLAPAVSTVSDDALWLSGELAPLPGAVDTEVRRLAASIDRTGSDQTAGGVSEREPVATQTGLAVPVASKIAGSDAAKPVRNDLPQDAQSRAIRALVREGISRNQTIDLLHLSGGKAVALRQIKRALGEEID